jgi:hypothetical protein
VRETSERYLVDAEGHRIGVLLSIEEYEELLEAAEELEAIRAYDAAKASGDEMIPFEQAVGGWPRATRMQASGADSGLR